MLTVTVEVARFPGCGRKIAELYQEWKDTGKTREAGEIDADQRLSVLALFYDIWGVGDVTARDFYNKGERDSRPRESPRGFPANSPPRKAGETSTTW